MLTIHNLKVSTSCCALLYIICTCFTAYSWDLLLPKIQPQKIVLVFLLREFHGQRSLAGYSTWGHKESNTTEQLSLSNYPSQARGLSTRQPLIMVHIIKSTCHKSHSGNKIKYSLQVGKTRYRKPVTKRLFQQICKKIKIKME